MLESWTMRYSGLKNSCHSAGLVGSAGGDSPCYGETMTATDMLVYLESKGDEVEEDKVKVGLCSHSLFHLFSLYFCKNFLTFCSLTEIWLNMLCRCLIQRLRRLQRLERRVKQRLSSWEAALDVVTHFPDSIFFSFGSSWNSRLQRV